MKAVHKRVDLVSNKKLMKTMKSSQVKTVTHHLKNETETKYLCFGSSKNDVKCVNKYILMMLLHCTLVLQ